MNQIKQLRWKKKMSLRELSRRSGVDIADISRIENFKTLNPTQATIAKISYGLKESPEKCFNLNWISLRKLM